MWLTGGTIFGLRIATLGLRFALAVYVTALLGLADMGRLGIVQGLSALVPAVIGMGYNFHMCRDVVGGDPAGRIAIVRDRLAWSMRMAALAATLGLGGWWLVLGRPDWIVLVVVAILWAEALAMDAYLALTGLRMNVLANVGVLLRTAAWVPIAIAGGWLAPDLRTLDFVYACWLGGHVANFALLYRTLHARGLWPRWRDDPPTGWLGRTRKGAVQIWPSDVALVLISYGDRFILAAIVGEAALGAYVFFWTFANMIRTLMQSSVVTPALPRLIELNRVDRASWLAAARRLGIAIPLVGATASAGMLAFVWAGHAYVPQGDFPWDGPLAVAIFAAILAIYCGDYLSTVLNSAGAVRAYSTLNIAFAGVLMLGVLIGALTGGVIGAVVASLIVALVFDALKVRAVVRV
ncbi:hypothetical protein AB433_03400 [Croceicoccus naphthovorans]|uniref:Polysaccharide biosynthesis protein n=2 Tax=Croceicoccus naphthovorans TaxID=1348774 RepID=A0A0G3XF15_9SPHN|nr:hypothetical protein AB433_03400 [Croceicoccus naphthovorans]